MCLICYRKVPMSTRVLSSRPNWLVGVAPMPQIWLTSPVLATTPSPDATPWDGTSTSITSSMHEGTVTVCPDLPRAVLLDLDGTLADTAPDLAGAINALLVEQGRGVLPYEAIRPHASHGSPALVRLAFGIEQT